jgi:hypothetical protein
MEAKHKAEQLVNNMLYTDIMVMSKHCAKQCALLAVYQIIKIDKLADNNINYKEYSNDCADFRSYWQEVKQEIEKL